MLPGTKDLLCMMKNPRLVFFMAWGDIRARYKRSVLGPFWITLSTLVGVVGLGVVWSELFKLDRQVYVPLLSVGLILWQFLSGSITEASSLYGRQANMVRNLNLPLSFYPSQLLIRQILNLAHMIPLYFLVMIVLDAPMNSNAFWAIPGFILVFLNMFWIILLVAILGARFRDLEYMIGMVMPLLLFFTPVLYRPASLPISGGLIWLNPLAHFVEIIRYPLLGEAPPFFIIATNCGLLLVGSLVTFFLFNAKRNRIAMWV